MTPNDPASWYPYPCVIFYPVDCVLDLETCVLQIQYSKSNGMPLLRLGYKRRDLHLSLFLFLLSLSPSFSLWLFSLAESDEANSHAVSCPVEKTQGRGGVLWQTASEKNEALSPTTRRKPNPAKTTWVSLEGDLSSADLWGDCSPGTIFTAVPHVTLSQSAQQSHTRISQAQKPLTHKYVFSLKLIRFRVAWYAAVTNTSRVSDFP